MKNLLMHLTLFFGKTLLGKVFHAQLSFGQTVQWFILPTTMIYLAYLYICIFSHIVQCWKLEEWLSIEIRHMAFTYWTIRHPLLTFFLFHLIYFIQLEISNFRSLCALNSIVRCGTLAFCFTVNFDANTLKIIVSKTLDNICEPLICSRHQIT